MYIKRKYIYILLEGNPVGCCIVILMYRFKIQWKIPFSDTLVPAIWQSCVLIIKPFSNDSIADVCCCKPENHDPISCIIIVGFLKGL